MSRLGIRRTDVVESFVKSSGPGGQNVNKTSTAVYLKHIPTGVEVKCQKERSQALNRISAWQLLAQKIEAVTLGNLCRQRQRLEKIRRQERKRSKKAKLKILEAKRRHAQKKKLRSKISQIE